jgi:hypothetical protein
VGPVYRVGRRGEFRVSCASYRPGQSSGDAGPSGGQDFARNAQSAFQNMAASAAEFAEKHQVLEKAQGFVRATSQKFAPAVPKSFCYVKRRSSLNV